MEDVWGGFDPTEFEGDADPQWTREGEETR